MCRRSVAIALLGLLLAPAVAAERLRDPTRPTGRETPSRAERPAGPVLSAILVARGRRVAVINGASLAVGDSVDGLQVIEISSDAVQVLTRSGKTELRLSSVPVKRPRAAELRNP